METKVIVITGSTRGIGYGLADAFLARGATVMVSGRDQMRVNAVALALSSKYGPGRVFGKACDVTHFEQVQTLWDAAISRFQRVDIWINNAGVAHGQTPLSEQDPMEMRVNVETNILGTMYGTRVALAGMKGQGFGAIYNMEGLGSTGRQVEGMAVYGTTKYGLRYFNHALQRETASLPVIAGVLRPGMVVTDLLTVQRDANPVVWERQKRIFNILADRVETVAPWLVDRILENTKNGAIINWSSGKKMMLRFLTSSIHRRHVID